MIVPIFSRIDTRWWMLAAALSLGMLAAWGAQRHIQSLVNAIEAKARVPMRPVVVAAADLPAGTRLDLTNVAVRDVPVEWSASDALLPADIDSALGTVLVRPLQRGDPVPWGYLEQVQQHQPFSAQLAAGRRAVTIPVDEINSLSGMLEPGDLIDLYVSFDHRQRRVTAALLQGVKVLATGRQHDADGLDDSGYGRGFATVTLDASPEDAVKLIAARQQGSISAMLRHGGDAFANDVAARGDLAALLGLADPAPTPRGPVPVIFGDRNPRAIPHLGETGVVHEESFGGPGTGPSPAPAASPELEAFMADVRAARPGFLPPAGPP